MLTVAVGDADDDDVYDIMIGLMIVIVITMIMNAGDNGCKCCPSRAYWTRQAGDVCRNHGGIAI